MVSGLTQMCSKLTLSGASLPRLKRRGLPSTRDMSTSSSALSSLPKGSCRVAQTEGAPPNGSSYANLLLLLEIYGR